MRNAATAAVGLTALFLTTATPGIPTSIDVAERVIPAVQRVELSDGYGSGSVLRCDRNAMGGYTVIILTAKHVILDSVSQEPSEHVSVLGHKGTVIAAHDSRDIALVEVDLDFMLPAIPGIRVEPLTPGEKVYGFGYSLSRQMWVTEGIASSDNRAGFAAPGDSGGAQVDKFGYLVGVTIAIDRHGWSDLAWHHTYIEPTHNMIEWLEMHVDIRHLLR